jgi:hypothetical protein
MLDVGFSQNTWFLCCFETENRPTTYLFHSFLGDEVKPKE